MTPTLVERLLNDAGDDPDRLPVLQHALMQTWQRPKRGNELDLRHYTAAGTMERALDHSFVVDHRATRSAAGQAQNASTM